ARQGDRAPHQGLQGPGAGLDPGRPGARGREEPRRSPEDHRADQGKGSRHRAAVHELSKRLIALGDSRPSLARHAGISSEVSVDNTATSPGTRKFSESRQSPKPKRGADEIRRTWTT